MKKIGIIAEYNPFHAGHAYQINSLRQMHPDAAIVVIMSGHFVQRGEPAIFDPYVRTETALENGADAVFMMPVSYSTASAEEFASCGIEMLTKLGCEAVCFGIEGDAELEELKNIAGLSASSEKLKEYLRSGMSYPAAMSKAFGFNKLDGNNILAVEYLKAIERQKAPLEPIAIKRIGHGYNDSEFDEEYASALAIRKVLLRDEADDAIGPDDLVPFLRSVIVRLNHEDADFTQYLDVSEEIANRIRKEDFFRCTFEETVIALKSKQYTYSRISRCLIHILLDIKKHEPIAYQLLGFKKDSTEILKGLDIISKAADHKQETSQEAFASAVYSQIYEEKFKKSLPNFYSHSVIIK